MSEYLIQDTTLDDIADAINAKTGKSAAMTPAEMVTEIESIETGGGGGMQLIANGAFTGAGVHNVEIPVGKKMPQTDFMFAVWVEGGTTITPTSSVERVVTAIQQLNRKRFNYYDLSSNGRKDQKYVLTYPTVESDGTTITNRTPQAQCDGAGYTRMASTAGESHGISSIVRDDSGFTIGVVKNAQYPFGNGITYNWEILYFGSDPTNDIVEVP